MTETTFSMTTSDIKTAESLYAALRVTPPRTRMDLKNYVKVFLGIDVPDRQICPDHSSPMDYLWNRFTVDTQRASGAERRATNDIIVWANRAGGKTELAAIATLLDCIFKSSCQVRILGGSGEQAGRMYEYLTAFLRHSFEPFLAGPALKAKCYFLNGSAVEVLTQSATSVRGQHVQKLRCDELELFNEDVFAAAKFTTRSIAGINAAMELISTMHRPYGLMHKAVSEAPKSGTPVFRWCVWEVIEKCLGRSCSQCPLWSDCQGNAKKANGYLKIDDCIAQMQRASRASWEAEMLCKRPSRENVVFDEFDAAVHVQPIDYDANLPLYRALDFGFVNPFVCLWIQVDDAGVVRVIDEYVRSRATIDVHAAEIKNRTPVREEQVAETFCDPAGRSANDVTGTSAIRELRALGIAVRSRRSAILEGVELIRRAIRSGDGKSGLIISLRCPRLIEAMQCYHYPESGNAPGELPLKDGLYDHPIDALRYFFINHTRPAKTTTRRY
ncbi:MAG: phage terminase large subunit family protein [Planctomycetota bacterium]